MASVTLRCKPITKKGFSIFLDIYVEGTRYKEYLKLYVSKDYSRPENKNILKQDKENWELALAIQAKKLLAIKESAAGFVPKANKQDFISFYKEEAEKKAHDSYDNAFNYFLDFLGKEKLSFKALDEHLLRRFISYLKVTSLSPSSIAMYLSRISIVLNIAVKKKKIQVNPFDYLTRGIKGDIPLPQKKKIEYLKIDELRKLHTTQYLENVRQFFLFSCFTGLRQGDLRNLKWKDIDETQIVYSQIKQGKVKTHYLPLSAQAKGLLKEIKESQTGKQSEYIFSSIPEERMVNKHLKAWARKAKLEKNLHIHVGRHTFATLALTNGASLYTVSKMLGHSSIEMTQVYAEVIDEVKQKAVDHLPML